MCTYTANDSPHPPPLRAPPPPILSLSLICRSYTEMLLLASPNRRHLFVTLWSHLSLFKYRPFWAITDCRNISAHLCSISCYCPFESHSSFSLMTHPRLTHPTTHPATHPWSTLGSLMVSLTSNSSAIFLRSWGAELFPGITMSPAIEKKNGIFIAIISH